MSIRTSLRPLITSVLHSAPSQLRTGTVAAIRAPALSSLRGIPQLQLQLRLKSTSVDSKWMRNPIVEYDELKPITEQPSDQILIVDVREPDEVALGSIPSSVNLPLSELKEALDQKTGPGQFQNKYAFPKPHTTQQMIFFCRSGKRSATAAEMANEKGYRSVRNYRGSWLDWEKKEAAGGGYRGGDDDD